MIQQQQAQVAADEALSGLKSYTTIRDDAQAAVAGRDLAVYKATLQSEQLEVDEASTKSEAAERKG